MMLILVIVCLSLVALSGCAETAPPPEPATVVFAHPAFESDYYRALVREFNEAYPYITVELVGTDTSDPADVFVGSSFALDELPEGGQILSLDPFIEQDASFDLDDFYPGAVELFTRDGDTWAVPADITMMVMFYNRDLFDEYGVAYPEPGWTWDDFLTKALALRDPVAGVFGYVPINGFLDPLAFIAQHGGGILDDWQNPTRTTLDDPLTIEAMEWYADLMHEHRVAPTPDQIHALPFEGSVQGGVYRGKVGMWSDWLAEGGGGGGLEATWPAEWEMRWGVVPLPRDAQAATMVFVRGYFISSQASNPQACWRWVSFLSQRLPVGLTPARRSLAESATYGQRVGGDVAAAARASMESPVWLNPSLFAFGNAAYRFGRALDAIVDGRSTAAEAMYRAQQASERGD